MGLFTCLFCASENAVKRNTKNLYCGNACQQSYQRKQRFDNLESGGTENHRVIRDYLVEKFGHTCSRCKLSVWNEQPMPVELEHIDGNSENNTLRNCCLLCPNCHAQTPTYKAKNIGNGRHSRRERYKNGKSF